MQKRAARLQEAKGLSLPEVLVACLITAAGILSILTTLLSSRIASTGAKHWTQAMNLASARIEQFKSFRYADLQAMPSQTTESAIPLDDRGGGGAVQCTRLTYLTQESAGIAITVLVTWTEKAAGSGSVPWVYDLRTWVAFPGAPS
jgi:Tfp pilus assembly protein PilV